MRNTFPLQHALHQVRTISHYNCDRQTAMPQDKLCVQILLRTAKTAMVTANMEQ